MAAAPSVMRAILLEQTERTRKSSKTDVERFIEESELKIASLESQIARERACSAALRHLFSPIHTLPVELLAEIFDLAIPGEQRHVRDALRISQVCSYWRHVAHSTPRLWTRPMNIYIRQGRGGDGEQAYADGLKTWLQRSASLVVPVTLVLEYVYCDSESSNNHIRDGVLSTAPRWRSLNVPRTTSLAFVQQLSEGRFDSLEELDLGLERFAGVVSTTSISFTVPRLRKLRINMWSKALRIDIFMPWAQLTDLTLDSYFPDITVDILAHCTSLIQANIRTTGWDVLPEPKQDLFALEHLRALSLLFFGSAGHVIPILESMSIPALKGL
ncbi:F-box domain-containing protein [Mycena sanguinolenta]|uniref:F-box domain-containing protein n=1 Tax=Mycena sanguinolenta TaxID=230812 RepID=A0A8H6YAX3_9AGAR|nr:F-box domain-containing protein [Mycena sanguinolenta]